MYKNFKPSTHLASPLLVDLGGKPPREDGPEAAREVRGSYAWQPVRAKDVARERGSFRRAHAHVGQSVVALPISAVPQTSSAAGAGLLLNQNSPRRLCATERQEADKLRPCFLYIKARPSTVRDVEMTAPAEKSRGVVFSAPENMTALAGCDHAGKRLKTVQKGVHRAVPRKSEF